MGLDPMHTKLAVVGDVNRSGSIVLAVTPPLKALGVKKNVWFGIYKCKSDRIWYFGTLSLIFFIPNVSYVISKLIWS